MNMNPDFVDMEYFVSKRDFLEYIQGVTFPRSYVIKYDPEIKRRRKYEYYNIPCSFDIETTSFYYNGEKCATMYLWGFNLNGRSIYGRTWKEFFGLLDLLHDVLNTDNVNLIIWVHNLSYEFNWFCRWLQWESVFCMKSHEVARAKTTTGIEFRCSLLESGKRLSKLAEEIKENPVRKLDTLEYSGMRHSKTPLTDLELMYQLNDVRIVANYIYEKGKKRYGGIPNILMTKTGYVREAFRKATIDSKERNTAHHYHNLIKYLTMTIEEYEQAEKTFQGGFVHASYLYIDEILDNVASFDICSDYPSQMVAREFPMSKGEYIGEPTPEELELSLSLYACMFRVEFTNIRQKRGVYDNPISKDHCKDGLRGEVVNNGRIKRADWLVTWITNVDYEIYKDFYDWDSCKISELWRYEKGYLPTPFIKTLLELYKNKTTLKGVKGKEEDLLLSKENLNSSYGMTVQKPLRPQFEFDGQNYVEIAPKRDETLEKYNSSRKRFLFFLWGVFVTSWARKSILYAVKECGKDYVYSDTDSCKILNPEKHLHVFENYNNMMKEMLYKAVDYHRLPRELVEPENIKGVKKLLGVFEYEHDEKPFRYFKTLGAKRYMVYDGEDIEITVAGLSKNEGANWLKMSGKGVRQWFNTFTSEMTVPAQNTGKLTHTYIDHEITAVLTDKFGITADIYEKSCIHLEPCQFSMKLSDEFLNFLLGYVEDYGLYGQD